MRGVAHFMLRYFFLALLGVGCRKHSVTDGVFQDSRDAGLAKVSVRIAAVGDISAPQIAGQAQTADLVMEGGYAAVLLLGDLQYPNGDINLYRSAFAPTWGRFLEKLWPSPGNHDYGVPGAAGYFEYFGSRAGKPGEGWYSFDLGAWHLISLNTNSACGEIPCDENSAQVRWLKEDLAAHRKACTLAFWHHPRFSSGARHGDFAGADALWKVLQQSGADVVLNGHEHFYERFEPMNGLREFIVGTGGISHYEFREQPHPSSAVRHVGSLGVLALELKESSYSWEFVPVSPSTFRDTGSDVCR
jgi:hypothetical protein